MHVAEDVSDALFTVGRKGPQAFILEPQEGTVVTPGTPLFLQGYAYDLEDGALDDAALRWSSSRDGDLGMGTTVLANLSPGQHVITLTATDSDGNPTISTISLFVGYRTHLPLVVRDP